MHEMLFICEKSHFPLSFVEYFMPAGDICITANNVTDQCQT